MNDPSTPSSTASHTDKSITARQNAPGPLIGVVGPCGAGKTTLITSLQQRGYHCRHIAQEHSYVPTMWKVITRPDLLIYLHCSFENSTRRRKLNWLPTEYEEQLKRLSHARQHADLFIDTDPLTPKEILDLALDFLNGHIS